MRKRKKGRQAGRVRKERRWRKGEREKRENRKGVREGGKGYGREREWTRDRDFLTP